MIDRASQANVDARTEAILEAATRLFAVKGIERTSMQEIAAEAGLSAGAVYRYFASKDDLMRACLEAALLQNERLFDEAAERAGSPLHGLFDVGAAVLGVEADEYVPLDTGDPDLEAILHLEFALAAARDPEHSGPRQRTLARQITGLVERSLRQAQAAGEVDSGLDARALAVVLHALVPGLETLRLQYGEDPGAAKAMDMVRRLIERKANAPPS